MHFTRYTLVLHVRCFCVGQTELLVKKLHGQWEVQTLSFDEHILVLLLVDPFAQSFTYTYMSGL